MQTAFTTVAAGGPLDDAYDRIPRLTTCSFDIFDTFLFRRTTTPEGVYELTARLLASRRSTALPVESFVQHRILAEAKARREAGEARDSAEVRIEDIYAHFPVRLFGFAGDEIATLIDTEFEAELALCFANPDMLRLFDAMKRAGIKVGFISDTYWHKHHVHQLLNFCQPDLAYDFLYVSSESNTGKAERLFPLFIKGEGVHTATALHIGDNEAADIKGGQRAGLGTVHYAQASEILRSGFDAESFAFKTFCGQDRQSARLDGGLRSLRRAVDKRLLAAHASHEYGGRALGPVMAGFDRFVSNNIEALAKQEGRKVATAYLGRDGFLPWRIAVQRGDVDTHYVEINRRVSLIASATSADQLSKLFASIREINATAAKAMLKFKPALIDRIFEKHGKPIMTGKCFSAALAAHFRSDDIASHAAAMRDQMLVYLRHIIPNFDDVTDLILVDLGYSATVQKCLRQIFDLAGITTRLHGLYLLTLDDAVDAPSGDDTITGFISDLVVTPHAKRALLRNIAVLEQMCAAPEGSVRHYSNGKVEHERDPRSAPHLALCADIQSGAFEFAQCLAETIDSHRLDPFADGLVASSWCAALLARMLLLPSAEELTLLAALKHDVNLGTQALAPMTDTTLANSVRSSRGLGIAMSLAELPMWLGGSMADISPLNGILYSMFGAGHLPPTLLAGQAIGQVDVALIAGQTARPVRVSVYRSVDGRVRLQVPMLSSMALSAVAVSIGQIAASGAVTSATLMSGQDASTALASANAWRMPDEALSFAGVSHAGKAFNAADPDRSYLIINLPAPQQPVEVLCIEFDVAEPAGSTQISRNRHAAA